MRIVAVAHAKPHRWAALPALVLLLCALTMIGRAADAPASLESKRDATQGKLDEVRQHKGVLTTTISRYNSRIGTLQGRVSALRNREAEVQQQLDKKQAQLERAEAVLATEKAHLVKVRGHLRSSLLSFRKRLVSIYETGTPDVLGVVLASDGWSDLVSRSEYLDHLQSQDQRLVDRVRELRNESRAVVDRLRAARDQIESARNTIAAQKQALVRTRSSIEAHQSKLRDARGKREDALAQIKDHEQELEGRLGDIQQKIAEKLLGPGAVLPAGAIQGGSNGFIWPVNGAIVSGFGMRWGQMHEGVDIAVPSGTPIRAAASGSVAIASWVGGYGNYTCINHGGGLSTCYGHQEAFAVSAGQSVSQGQVIGYSDCTGHCFGPHVHFEVRINGAAVDPMAYL
jgi:murein DD-endopeptidase MepM/ murein hydrolase activator NlpD